MAVLLALGWSAGCYRPGLLLRLRRPLLAPCLACRWPACLALAGSLFCQLLAGPSAAAAPLPRFLCGQNGIFPASLLPSCSAPWIT